MTDWSFRNLNFAGVQVQRSRQTLAPGRYVCKVTEAEIKVTKDGKGRQLRVKLEDTNGAGSVEDYINIYHPNETATRIGMERCKSLMVFGGHPNPDRPGDVRTLIGLVVGVIVENEPFERDGKTFYSGKPKKNGAYFDPKELGYDRAAAADAAGNSGGIADEIPF